MATKYWTPTAPAVAQVATASIDSVDGTPANNTFTVTIGGVAIDAVGDTDVATTAAALVASMNASTHPYFAAITWTNPSAGNITGTADTAGVPFTAALTETGAGTGAVTDFADDTACNGPNFFDTAANWSTGTVPANSDTLIFAESAVPCAWNINTSLTGLTFYVDASYTGTIGLDATEFATSADSATTDSAATEYRDTEMTIDATLIELGRLSSRSEDGSAPIRIYDALAGSATCIVHSTGTSSAGNAVTYRANNAASDIEIREATGGVGIGTAIPGQTTTLGTINISGDNAATRVDIGDGVTVTGITQNEGTMVMRSAATVTTVTVYGGECQIEGSGYTITTLQAWAGEIVLSGAVTVTTADMEGATLDTSQSEQARTIGTLNLDRAGDSTSTFLRGDNVTVSSFSPPASLRYRLDFVAI